MNFAFQFSSFFRAPSVLRYYSVLPVIFFSTLIFSFSSSYILGGRINKPIILRARSKARHSGVQWLYSLGAYLEHSRAHFDPRHPARVPYHGYEWPLSRARSKFWAPLGVVRHTSYLPPHKNRVPWVIISDKVSQVLSKWNKTLFVWKC